MFLATIIGIPLIEEQGDMGKLGNIAYRWGGRAIKIAFFAAAITGVVYWLKFSPIQISTHLVKQGPLVAEVMGTGTLEARVQATISPKISDRIEKIFADQGDRVLAGDLLIQLDDDELQQQVAIAQANAEAATAAIRRLKIDKDRAAAIFDQAQKNNARIQRLVPSNAVTQDEGDKATESLALAVAGVASAEASIAEGQKNLVAAERTLQYQRTKLTATEIRAPFDGLVIKRNREAGDVVVPGSSIMTLISLDELWIRAWVDETEMAKLKEEQAARVVFRSESERFYPGTVARLGKEADRETREFVIDVRVLELPNNWAVGQRAEVYIEVDRKENAVQIPAHLIINRNDKTGRKKEIGVFVSDGKNARWRPISLGLRSRDFVEITDGLQPQEVLAVPLDPRVSLSEGRKISQP